MGGVRRIGTRVLSREESEVWMSRQKSPVCIVRLDAVTAELLLFYVAHRHKKEALKPYPSTLDETHLDDLFASTIEEGLPRIDAFLYGTLPYYEALLYKTYAPQAIALSYASVEDAPLITWEARHSIPPSISPPPPRGEGWTDARQHVSPPTGVSAKPFVKCTPHPLGRGVHLYDTVVETLSEEVAKGGASCVRLDGGVYQVALGVALKQRGISSCPKN
jgi:hypothetical protein